VQQQLLLPACAFPNSSSRSLHPRSTHPPSTPPPTQPPNHSQYQKWGMCLVYGIIQLINNTPKQTDPRVSLILTPEELALYNSTTKPSKLCGTMLSALTASAGFDVNREVYLNEMLGMVAANCSLCARVKLQSMPYGASVGLGMGVGVGSVSRLGLGRSHGDGEGRVRRGDVGTFKSVLAPPPCLHPTPCLAPTWTLAGMTLFCTGWTYVW